MFGIIDRRCAALDLVQDNYLDAYLRVIKETDPLTTALVFNCGMGAVRTTFAMVAACIVRRKQLIDRGLEDPYTPRSAGSRSGISTVCQSNGRRVETYPSHLSQPSGMSPVSTVWSRIVRPGLNVPSSQRMPRSSKHSSKRTLSKT